MRVLGGIFLVLALVSGAFAQVIGGGTGSGLNGTSVTNSPSGSGQCLASTSTTQAAWGSCGSGNLPALGSGGSFLLQNSAGNAAVWTLLTGDVSYSTVTVGLATVIGVRGKTVKNQAPTDAQFYIWNNTNSDWEPVSLSGDCTWTNAGAITCTKTNGTAFAALATLGVGTGLTSSGGNLNLTTPVTATNGGSGRTSPTAHSLLMAEGSSAFNLLTAATSGALIIDQGVGVDFSAQPMSGDCTIAANGTISCTKTSGVAFAASATTDTTNANNISSGTLAAGRGGTGSSTLPITGQVPIGNAGGTAYAPQSISGDSTLTNLGVMSNVKVNGNTPGGTCTNQAVTSVDSSARPTCSTLTSAYVNNSIALTGTDINTSNQVTATHLAAALPSAQGGTGVGSPTAHAIPIAEGASGFNLVSLAASQVLGMCGGADPVGLSLPNCGDATHAVAFSTATCSFTCQAITATASAGGTSGELNYNNATAFAGLSGVGLVKSNATTSPLVTTPPSIAAAGTDYVAPNNVIDVGTSCGGTAIQTALAAAAANAARTLVRLPSNASCAPSSGLTVDARYVSIDGRGATIDCSGFGSGTCLTATGAQITSGQPLYSQNVISYRNFELKGPGSGSSVNGFAVAGSHVRLEGINVHDFSSDVTIDAPHTYNVAFYSTNLWNAANALDSGTDAPADYGENINYYGGSIFNSFNGVELRNTGANLGADFFGTHIDGITANAFGVYSGNVHCFDCRIEYTGAQPTRDMIDFTGGNVFSSFEWVGGQILCDFAGACINSVINSHGSGVARFFDPFINVNTLSSGSFVIGSNAASVLIENGYLGNGGGGQYEVNGTSRLNQLQLSGGVNSLSGLIKGNGTSVPTAAVSGTDYAPATSGTAIQKGNGTGGFSSAVAGTDYSAATPGAANVPLFSNGAGGFTAGTHIGNTTQVATYAGSQAGSGHIATYDANGNLQDGGVGSNYATVVNSSGTTPTVTCSSVGGQKPSRDMIWQVLAGATTYTTPAAGCSDGDIIEAYFIQAANQAYQVTLADGTGTNHIGALFPVPTSTGQTNYFLHFALEYHSNNTQWELMTPQNTNPLPLQGNGALYQLSTGATTTGHCVQFDSHGNTTDAGAPCATSSYPVAGVTQLARTFDSGL